MKNRGIVFVLLLLAGAPFIEQVGGQCLGLDLSSVSFINLSDSRQPGLYARMGVTFNLSTETELKLAMISRLTPILIPYSCVSVGIGRNLLGSRKMKYFNTLIMSGMLLNSVGEHYLFIQIEPMTLGNVVTGCRESIFGIGVIYNLFSRKAALIWNLLGFTFYPSCSDSKGKIELGKD